jgi:hypothetical protein
MSVGAVCLSDGFLGTLAGAFGVDLCRADLPAPYDFARLGAHGWITAGFASPGNATRI